MQALPPSAVSQPASPSADVIEIVGTRAGEALKIDRRTYQVQHNPHSAQKDALQLLRGLPAVTISPDGTINLLGAANVIVMIDGHATHTDPRTLHGSDIDRIEIVTNPSAQYSAEGTGGIVNIVLRKKRSEGTSGTESLDMSSQGRANLDLSIKNKRKKWTYEAGLGAAAGTWSHSTYHKLRTIEPFPGGPATVNTEDGGGPARSRGIFGRLKATYDLDARTSISAEVTGGTARESADNPARFMGLTPDFVSFSQRQHDDGWANFATAQLTFDHKGKRDGETLKASLNLFGNPRFRKASTYAFSDGGTLRIVRDQPSLYGQGKLDWTHPIGKKQILSVGVGWDLQSGDLDYRLTSVTAAGVTTIASDAFRATQNTFSAYSTFQQPIGTWTVMPGLRVEHNRRRITSPGLPNLALAHTNLIPSLHVEHPICKALVLTLSYSRRLDRPNPALLRPYPIQVDRLNVTQGNPRLRDQSTDAFELNLHYHHKKIDGGVILYDRETRHLFASNYSVDALGRNVTTLVNAGRKRDRGAEFDLNMPLLQRVKLSTSVNLFSSRVPIDAVIGSASEERFRFTANSTFEWDGPDRRGKPGDVAQFIWHYESPSADFQFRNFAWHQLTLSYTHNFDRAWSVTATADSGALNNGHRLLAPLVQEYYIERRRPEFRVKLMKTFGKN